MNNNMNAHELTDEQLETVAGGSFQFGNIGNPAINIAPVTQLVIAPEINVVLFSNLDHSSVGGDTLIAQGVKLGQGIKN